MPWVEFLKDYPPYKKGQKIDLPGRLTWKLKAEKVVARIEPPASAVKKFIKRASVGQRRLMSKKAK